MTGRHIFMLLIFAPDYTCAIWICRSHLRRQFIDTGTVTVDGEPAGAVPGKPGITTGKELRGVIVDGDTGEPIADAIVVSKWITSSGPVGGSELICFHAGSAVTNAAGEYYMPAWSEENRYRTKRDRDILIFAHKPGYRWQYLYPPKENHLIQYIHEKLVISRDPHEERLEYLDEAAS